MEWFESDEFWRDFYPYMFPAERFAAAKDDVARIITLTQCSGGKVLDLCCGPGRHAVEFTQRGFQVTGVDRSSFLLNRAREHAGQTGAAVEWVKEDMRRFVRPTAFDVACNLFTSFGYFTDEQDNLQVLRNLCQCLKEGGALVMEMLGKERLARNWQNSICTELPDGTLLLQRPQLRDDWCRIVSEWVLIKDGHTRSFSFEHSIYSGRELKDRLLSSGFQKVELFGDLLGSPYGLDAARLVAVARKAAV
jgi:SAM-dependent methyltransferase